MKAVFASILFSAAAVARAADCDTTKLASIANSADASNCKIASNFVVPVESTTSTILTNLESFCMDTSCQRVLEALHGIDECSIDGGYLHQSVVHPIADVCSATGATRALKAADGSHAHGSTMEMSSGSAEAEDSHDATASSAETGSSEMEDSHDITPSSSGSAAAGDDHDHDSHDTASSTASSSAGSKASTNATSSMTGNSTGSSTAGSKATASNSTSTTQAPNASGTSSAGSITVALGSVVLAVAAAFL